MQKATELLKVYLQDREEDQVYVGQVYNYMRQWGFRREEIERAANFLDLEKVPSAYGMKYDKSRSPILCQQI